MSALIGKIGKGYVVTSSVTSMLIIVLIVGSLVTSSWAAIGEVGIQLFTLTWNPSNGHFGILPMLYGTMAVAAIALTVAVPIGLMIAIFTAEFLANRYRLLVKSVLEVLAGIPSIIYGLIGVAFFSVWVRDVFEVMTGRTILTAGLLLGIMVLPMIVTLVDDALYNVPDCYRETARALGMYDYEVIRNAVWPIARPKIVSAVLLALGRALGETMAVMLVIGGIDRIPSPVGKVLVPGQTITSKLGRAIAETAFGSLHFSVMIFMGMVLLCMVLVLTLAIQHTLTPLSHLYE